MNSKLVREARKTATLIARVRVPGPTCSTGTSQGAHGTYGRGWQGQPEAPEAQEAPVHKVRPQAEGNPTCAPEEKVRKIDFARLGGGHPKCCKSQGKPYTPPSAHFPFFCVSSQRKIMVFLCFSASHDSHAGFTKPSTRASCRHTARQHQAQMLHEVSKH